MIVMFDRFPVWWWCPGASGTGRGIRRQPRPTRSSLGI